jgi:CheY-like chemotaxis protein
VYRIWDDYDRGSEKSAAPQWQARSPISLLSLNSLERQFLQVVEHNLFVGFSHAAFLLLAPQCPTDSSPQSDAQRSALMDVVATGSAAKLQVPRSLGKLGLVPCAVNRNLAFKFLIVDDDMVNRLIMSQKLTMAKEFKGLSAECDQAEHGEAALQKLHKLHANGGTQYDVLIFDEHMEGSGGKLKGSEVIRKLRQEGCESVIVSCSVSCSESNGAGESNTGDFLSAGADICWTKPFPSPDQMYLDLGRFLHSHSHANTTKH